jgi:hypothetical protein
VNTVVGVAQTSRLDPGQVLEALRAMPERGPVAVGTPSNGNLQWASTSNGGVVLGTARAGARGIAYLGSFHGPFPEMMGTSPLDDPNRTAQCLLQRYAERGRDFLRDLCGHFAVLVVEPDDGRVVLARGHGSAVRWFVAEEPGRLVFSTKLADLPHLMGTPAALDRSMENFLLGYEFLPDGRTPFANVRVLLPGTMLEWQRGECTRHELAPPVPWGGRFDSVDYRDEREVIAVLHDSFRMALADQVADTSRVAVLLGGVDSALIAVELKRLGKNVHTFSFCYDDASYNQAHVEELASQFGLSHHWVPITADVIRQGLQHYAQRFNQPLSQPHYVIASAEACRAIRGAGILHALTGDGCDGLFLGYPTVHFRAQLIQKLSRLGPLISGSLEPLTRSAWWERKLGHPYRVARNVARVLRRPMPARGHVAACTLDEVALQQLHGPSPEQSRDVEQILAQLAHGLEGIGEIRLAYLGKSRVGLNGVKLDGALSYSGISLNSPYLHPGLERVAKSIPDALSRPNRATKSKSTGKYAFLQMIEQRGLLPSEIVYQKKRSPVTAPVDDWYWGTLRSFLLERLAQLPFPIDRQYAESLVTPKLAERLFRDHVGISRQVTQAVSLLTTYASFAELMASDARHARSDISRTLSLDDSLQHLQ